MHYTANGFFGRYALPRNGSVYKQPQNSFLRFIICAMNTNLNQADTLASNGITSRRYDKAVKEIDAFLRDHGLANEHAGS